MASSAEGFLLGLELNHSTEHRQRWLALWWWQQEGAPLLNVALGVHGHKVLFSEKQRITSSILQPCTVWAECGAAVESWCFITSDQTSQRRGGRLSFPHKCNTPKNITIQGFASETNIKSSVTDPHSESNSPAFWKIESNLISTLLCTDLLWLLM